MQCMTIWIKISIECINVNYSRITEHTCVACFRFENDCMNLFLAQETSELQEERTKAFISCLILLSLCDSVNTAENLGWQRQGFSYYGEQQEVTTLS